MFSEKKTLLCILSATLVLFGFIACFIILTAQVNAVGKLVEQNNSVLRNEAQVSIQLTRPTSSVIGSVYVADISKQTLLGCITLGTQGNVVRVTNPSGVTTTEGDRIILETFPTSNCDLNSQNKVFDSYTLTADPHTVAQRGAGV